MRTKLEFNAESLQAIHDAVGALVCALTYELPDERREPFVRLLMALAQSKTSNGQILAGTALLDYAYAADWARNNPEMKKS